MFKQQWIIIMLALLLSVMTYNAQQLLWLMRLWAELMGYPSLNGLIIATTGLECHKQMIQFWLRDNAIKSSLGLSLTKIMRSEPEEPPLLIDSFSAVHSRMLWSWHAILWTWQWLCLCLFFYVITKDLFEIIVEQPGQHFFLLLKHTHVNIIFYL